MSKVKVDLSGLKKFKEKLNKLNSIDTDLIAEAIADRGVKIARKEYTGTKIIVEKEKGVNGEISVVAKGKEVAYMEFGTGLQGKATGYSKETLPKETITFKSRGKQQTTDGWQYDYYWQQNHKDNPNLKHWIGKPAQMQMLNTSNILNMEKKEIAKKVIMGDSK